MADLVRKARSPRPTGRPAECLRPSTTRALCLSAAGAPDPRIVVHSVRYRSSSRRFAHSPRSSRPIRRATSPFRRATAAPALRWAVCPLSAALPSFPPSSSVSNQFPFQPFAHRPMRGGTRTIAAHQVPLRMQTRTAVREQDAFGASDDPLCPAATRQPTTSEEPVATGARTSGTSSSARRRNIAAVSARCVAGQSAISS